MFLDENSLRALILSFFAGISTVLGAFILFFLKDKNEKIISISLGFSGGVMISVSFTHLLPHANELLEGYFGHDLGVLLGVLFLVLGVVIAACLDKFVPHINDECSNDYKHQNLFRVGFISMLAIGLHNFPEGVATFMAGYNNLSLGISVAIAIALHNIPEGVSVAMPIYCATGDMKKAFKYTFLSGIVEPIGALLTFLVLRPYINEFSLGAIFALISGIMLYIAIEELIPSSRQYGYIKIALISTFVGIILMPLTHLTH
ncbi:zinc transporter ZupT [Fusobacterium sp.]|uniref:zinc transporter ZupT n=1 Tax=Fusobacterium sp. TaxID=68766 RepID=UPI0025C5A986|nr:zinc transporter ZupT [Fusobacterium sp.]